MASSLLPPRSGRLGARSERKSAGSGSTNAEAVELLVPIPRPNKLLLLAGNYNEHLQEGGGAGTERAETFPYVFTKPPSTTLNDPGKAVVIPKVSPITSIGSWSCVS